LADRQRSLPQAQIEVIFDGRVNEMFIICNTSARANARKDMQDRRLHGESSPPDSV
jgi:hypothetical protein